MTLRLRSNRLADRRPLSRRGNPDPPVPTLRTNGTWVGTATTGNWSTGTKLAREAPFPGRRRGSPRFNNLTGQVSGFHPATIDHETRTLRSDHFTTAGYSFTIRVGCGGPH